jgi:predicted AAA+ superfamily ATPase
MLSKKDLELRNPWWVQEDYKIIEQNLPKRDLHEVLVENFSHSLMLNIVGLRRVGKSTLLKQLIGRILEMGEKPTHVFYYLFDYATQSQKADFLDEVLATYFQEVLKRPNFSLDEKVYVFLDEIQYIKNWQAVLKRYYDCLHAARVFVIFTNAFASPRGFVP